MTTFNDFLETISLDVAIRELSPLAVLPLDTPSKTQSAKAKERSKIKDVVVRLLVANEDTPTTFRPYIQQLVEDSYAANAALRTYHAAVKGLEVERTKGKSLAEWMRVQSDYSSALRSILSKSQASLLQRLGTILQVASLFDALPNVELQRSVLLAAFEGSGEVASWRDASTVFLQSLSSPTKLKALGRFLLQQELQRESLVNMAWPTWTHTRSLAEVLQEAAIIDELLDDEEKRHGKEARVA